MGSFWKEFLRFGESESGTTAIEYALLGSLISVAIIVALTSVSGQMIAIFDSWTGAVHNAVSGS